MSRYEFALLRYVHDLASGEFANIGVVMLDAEASRLLVRTSEHYRRLSGFFGEMDGAAYHAIVRHVERAFLEVDEALRAPDAIDPPPGDLASAIQRALPGDASAVQSSAVMFGVHDEPQIRFAQLYEEFVARYDRYAGRVRRDDGDLRRDFTTQMIRSDLRGRVVLDYEIQAPNYSHRFTAGWRNGKAQVLDTISFDIIDGQKIVEKANLWSGRLFNLARGADFDFTAMVAPPPAPEFGRAFDRALAILDNATNVRRILRDDQTEEALRQIREDVADQDG